MYAHSNLTVGHHQLNPLLTVDFYVKGSAYGLHYVIPNNNTERASGIVSHINMQFTSFKQNQSAVFRIIHLDSTVGVERDSSAVLQLDGRVLPNGRLIDALAGSRRGRWLLRREDLLRADIAPIAQAEGSEHAGCCG